MKDNKVQLEKLMLDIQCKQSQMLGQIKEKSENKEHF